MDRFKKFWEEKGEWADATFGTPAQRGPVGPLKHLVKEVQEALAEAEWIQNNPDKFDGVTAKKYELAVEVIDCFFLITDAARRMGMNSETFLDYAFHKLEINKARKWGKPSADGVVEHVRE